MDKLTFPIIGQNPLRKIHALIEGQELVMTWLPVSGGLALSSDSASMSICGAEKLRVGESSMIMCLS